MGMFDQHFKMEEHHAVLYAREKIEKFSESQNLTCEEIGDGNINYVFRVLDTDTGESIIIKHADVAVRSSGNRVSTDRNRIEAEVLQLEDRLAPGLVPKVYLYDPVMCCLVMEDLKCYRNMRYELIEHHLFPTFAEEMSTFLVKTLIGTTDLILQPEKKKELAKLFVNPSLCQVTERLVYTEPYRNIQGRNVLNPDNEAFFRKELYEDKKLHLEAAKLKELFKGKAQSLLHGDLHTGSVFVKDDGMKVLDPEFAFYGPAGYDIGNVVANLLFAWANAQVTMEPSERKEQFQGWLEQTIAGVVDLFYVKAETMIQTQAVEPMAVTDGFVKWYLEDILSDTAGSVGLEMNRRIVGSAKVKDIAGIADRSQRKLAERICVATAKECVMDRQRRFRQGYDYIETVRRIAEQIEKGE